MCVCGLCVVPLINQPPTGRIRYRCLAVLGAIRIISFLKNRPDRDRLLHLQHIRVLFLSLIRICK